jgi:hypothetical protein
LVIPAPDRLKKGQEIVMNSRRPTILRWVEEAEAEQVRLWSSFEREPQPAAARPVASATPPFSRRRRPALLPWLRRWLGGAHPQIERDDGRRDGLQ